jgi:dipeptide/tripeptide permease
VRAIYFDARGLFRIGGTGLRERMSFLGMQALLVLYMVEQLLLSARPYLTEEQSESIT